MNKERLLKLATLLHDHSVGRAVHIPGGHRTLILGTWLNEKRDCGTAACAVGCAMLSPAFQAEGLKVGRMPNWAGEMQPVPKFGKKLNWEAVEAFFNLNSDDAEHLFSGTEYPAQGHNPTPKQVAKRIRRFVTEHSA